MILGCIRSITRWAMASITAGSSCESAGASSGSASSVSADSLAKSPGNAGTASNSGASCAPFALRAEADEVRPARKGASVASAGGSAESFFSSGAGSISASGSPTVCVCSAL
jgi:hypothetical protein